MKLLLQKNIEHLGKIGDIVDVRPGYARNYLLPQGLAAELTKDNLHRFESMKRRLIAQEEENKAKQIVLAREIEKASCTIIANATEEGHLYGSVTERDIAAQLASEDLAVDPRWIILEEPIREMGIYKVKVRLHPEVETTIKVWVVKGDESASGDAGDGEDAASASEAAWSAEEDADRERELEDGAASGA